jgi:hypothetical protein
MLPNSFKSLLLQCIKILDDNHTNYWLDWGSLLQSTRGAEVFPYDFIFDLGIIDGDLHRVLPAIEKEIKVYKDLVLAIPDMQNLPNFHFKHSNIVDVHPMKWIIFWPYAVKDNALSIPFIEQGDTQLLMSDIFPLREIEFETIKIRAPRNIKSICRQRFGNNFQTELFSVLRPKKRLHGESKWTARLGTNPFSS